jgi:voltage-gated potassium channel
VEKKIKEGKGLEAIKEKDHVIICGWNENAEKVIDGILAQEKKAHIGIVLVNELDRDDVQSIQYKYKDHNLHFVRGNFAKEDVLARANLSKSSVAIVLADTSGGHSIERADQRTIFGTMAIKAMAPKVRTCAELINPDNREHLLRANVDEVIVRGQSTGSMLAKTAISPGVTDAIMLLIGDADENMLWRTRVPVRYVGEALKDLASHLREKSGALVLAVLKERERMRLEDILSEEPTIIDEFIKRKFQESGKDYFAGRKDVSVLLNPPDDYELEPNDWVLAICKEKP